MNDPIEELIRRIRARPDLTTINFASTALNSVGEVFERDGFGATRLYLLEKQRREESRAQATALIAVLDLMRDCPAIQQRRALGRALFKVLGSLRPVAQPDRTKGTRR